MIRKKKPSPANQASANNPNSLPEHHGRDAILTVRMIEQHTMKATITKYWTIDHKPRYLCNLQVGLGNIQEWFSTAQAALDAMLERDCTIIVCHLK